MDINRIEKYDLFYNVGFYAGIVLKGPSETQESIYQRITADIAPGNKKIVSPRQLHGSDIVCINNHFGEGIIPADGLLCRNRNFVLTVKTADCLPILLADPTTGLFGAIHIGWRGLAGGIMKNLLAAIKKLDTDFQRLYISLGPAIGACCFDVGAEVAVLFDEEFVTIMNDRYFLNIRDMVKKQLVSFGVSENQTLDIAECTCCHDDKYYSFRRDGHARIQMVSFIGRL